MRDELILRPALTLYPMPFLYPHKIQLYGEQQHVALVLDESQPHKLRYKTLEYDFCNQQLRFDQNMNLLQYRTYENIECIYYLK